jgi:hypothetical protein
MNYDNNSLLDILYKELTSIAIFLIRQNKMVAGFLIGIILLCSLFSMMDKMTDICINKILNQCFIF